MITIPLMLGLVFLRTPFITIALGPNWAITSNILLWLAPTGIIQSILSCSGSILMSTNNTKTLMLLGIFGAARQVLSFFIGSLFSINIFVFAYFIANVINALVVLYFTFKSRFVQFRYFGEMFRLLGQGVSNGKGKNSVSSFQAFCIATASRVGTGNLAGVATAVAIGGSGAVFWMWVLALIGSASAFVESTLAQIYKEKGERSFIGGPAFYI